MGIRFSNFGYDKMVEKLVEVEKIPVEQAKGRREKIVNEKKEVEKLQGLIAALDGAANGLKGKADFYHLKVESSHPDILEGMIKGPANIGSYEFEVRGLAKTDKQLAFGFPDKDKTQVGFGYMLVEREDMEPAEVVINPGSTLQDVAEQINQSDAGVRAMVINTGFNPEPFRLLVVSEKTGKEAAIHIDPDTTFLEFKNQVSGRNLDVLFEDVPVTSIDNALDELVENVSFRVKRSEPGTRVQVNVVYDMDATVTGIKTFVEKYNDIVKFAAEQSKNPKDGQPGQLSGDQSVKQVMRGLQSAIFPMGETTGKYRSLADIGITTNPKSGELQMDDAKVRAALTEDYESVAALFVRGKLGGGLGDRIADRIKGFRDPAAGVIKARLRGLEGIIENQDKEIERRERQLVEKEDQIKRRFSSLESQMSGLQAQGNYLAQRFGGGNQQPQGGGQ